jgi:cell division septum initiation protein DivIVA
MAHSESGGSESVPGRSARANSGGEATDSTGRGKQDDGSATRRLKTSIVSGPERDRMIKQTRDTEFPIALRGYERGAVDRYVEHVNRVLAELEISSSPESAVRHALDEVSEETRDILQRAHETADEITARSRSRADDRLQDAGREARELRAVAQGEADEMRQGAHREADELRESALREGEELRESAHREAEETREAAHREAEETRDAAQREAAKVREAAARDAQELRETAQGEAAELRDSAETRARDLARSTEAIWRERRRLIDDVRAVGEQLVAIGEVEGKRFSRLADEVSLAADERHERVPSASNGEPTTAP